MDTKNTFFLTALLAAALVFVFQAAPVFAQANPERAVSFKADITGTWLVNLEIDGVAGNATNAGVENLAPDAIQPFSAVETFHSDGTFAENSLADFLPPQGAPGRGVWARTRGNTFALTFYSTLIGSFNNPQFAGNYKVRSSLTVNRFGNTFNGPFKIDVYDPNGNRVATLTGRASGKRVEVESL